MTSLKLRALGALDDFNASGLARPAAEKFAGAWLACSLVMARGNVLAAFSVEHMLTASICGIVGALVTVLASAADGPHDRQRLPAGDHRGGRDLHRRHLRARLALPAAMGGAAGHGGSVRQHRGRGLAREAVCEERPARESAGL